MKRWVALVGVSLALAAGAGFMASQALSQGGATKEVTIDANGPRGPQGEQGERGPAGPAGPKGDKGEPGSTTCPDGYTLTNIRVNHPGGQTTILACTLD